jgi:hypothetical protein
MPSAPKFADLTKTQREDFIDFGPENWTEADVTLELVKLAKVAPAAPATEIVTEKRQTIEELLLKNKRLSQQKNNLSLVKTLHLQNHIQLSH